MFRMIFFQSHLAISCFDNFVALGLEKIDDQLPHELFIIGD